jgi:hypothetical protein
MSKFSISKAKRTLILNEKWIGAASHEEKKIGIFPLFHSPPSLFITLSGRRVKPCSRDSKEPSLLP